jgi:DNA primase small subunit
MTTVRGRYWTQETGFPLDAFYDAFTQGGRLPLARRNIRFRILRTIGGSETYYTAARVFHDKGDLQRFLAEHADCMVSIEMGAVYPVAGHMTQININLKSFGVYAKELVLDIDLNDYGALRTCACGSEKKSCPMCIELFLLKTAIPALKSAIEARGWTNASFNFSGGRGIHVWIYEEAVLTWDRTKRAAFLEYLARPPEKLLREWCATIYEPVWEEYFLVPNRWSDALEADYMVPCFGARPPTGDTLRAKWMQLQREPGFELGAQRFLHKLLGPRLDKEVTLDVHHLCKSPFSIHARTKYVATFIEDLSNPKIEYRFVE